MGVAVVGQIGRDLVLRTEGMPPPGGSVPVVERHELLGGKGANQAVGLAQLGVPVSLVGVVGEDAAGDALLRQAAEDGIDTTAVIRRGPSALLVDVIDRVDEAGQRRLLEHIPDESLLTEADLDRAAAVLDAADTVSLQLQQPAPVVRAAACRARQRGARVVADGAADRDELLGCVHVLRADAEEAELIAGRPVASLHEAEKLARELLTAGPELVALAVPDEGDLLAWPGGARLFGLADVPVADPTGAGDAFVAGLIAGLRQGFDHAAAGRLAAAAASATVQRLGGRPDLRELRRAPPPR